MEVQKAEEYSCEVRDVFSGDDLVVFVDLGVEDLWKKKRIRLLGVDTPNAVNAGEDTEAGRIRRQIRQIARGRRGILTVASKNLSSWVGTLVVEAPTAPNGVINLNQLLLEQGYVFKRATT